MLTTASHAPHVYIQCDIPDGMTLVEWRRAHSAPQAPPPPPPAAVQEHVMTATDARMQLLRLIAERRRTRGRSPTTRAAYVGLAVTEIATLRAQSSPGRRSADRAVIAGEPRGRGARSPHAAGPRRDGPRVRPGPLDVPALARIAHVSEAHFIREFRATFAETPHRYLQRRRVERATYLLRETDRSVAEICLDVGFASLGNVRRTFRAILGESTTAYRRRAAARSCVPDWFVRAWTRASGSGEARPAMRS